MHNGINDGNDIDMECLAAKIINHVRNHATNLYANPVASLQSAICTTINEGRNDSKLLNSLYLMEKSFTNESVKDLIRSVWSLKHERNLSDETAICALSLLLPEPAYKWWDETKSFVNSWHLAVAIMLKVLDTKRTLLNAWREFESSKYQNDNNLKSFLNEQRILLVEIRQFYKELTEQMEIDLIYYKLNVTIRKKVDRKRIESFADLIKLGNAEHCLDCDSSMDRVNVTCSYCKRYGHTVKTCRDKKDDTDRDKQRDRYHSSPIPSIPIKVNGIPDFAHLATDSQINVINDQLYCKLIERGCLFEPTKQIVSTIHSSKIHALQLATVTVECNGYLAATPVVKLQNSRGIKNCFGGSFIEACDLLMNIGGE